MELLGIDIGGTGIKGAPVDTVKGRLTADRFKLLTPRPATPGAVAEVVRRVAEHHRTVSGPVGITFPGVVVNGVVKTAANMHPAWIGFDADEHFTEHLQRPVHMLNDADAAGIAEIHFGAGLGVAGTVLLVTLGTGIGSALFVDGTLVPNTEFGHLEIDGQEAEKTASGRAQERDKLSWKDYSKRLQKCLTRFHDLVWPQLVIVGGGVSKESGKFLPRVSLPCPIVPAGLLNNAGIVGAALAARHLVEDH